MGALETFVRRYPWTAPFTRTFTPCAHGYRTGLCPDETPADVLEWAEVVHRHAYDYAWRPGEAGDEAEAFAAWCAPRDPANLSDAWAAWCLLRDAGLVQTS